MTNAISEELISPQARGKRLRYLRDALRLSREELGNAAGVPVSTLQNWEVARFGGLSEKGAKLMVKAFQAKGIEMCRLEWLFYGIGSDPLIPNLATGLSEKMKITDAAAITRELQLFHQLHPNGVDFIIADDGMLPCFAPGDIVAGKRYFDLEIAKAIGHPSIVYTHAGHLVVRQVESSKTEGLYTLKCTNPHTTIDQPIQKDIQLFSAAPIIWLRKKEALDES